MGGLSGNKILSVGRGEKLMDRFIPCRIGENLQAKFEAVSHKQEEEMKFNFADSNRVAVSLGLLDNDDHRSNNAVAIND